MPSNTAAYLTATGVPLEVKEAPYLEPKEDEIVIKIGAVAINPVDYFQQLMGPDVFKWLEYLTILGYDVAGEVEAAGPGVTRFKVGDRVAGFTSTGGFQEHVVLSEHMASPIPESLAYKDAAVLPMGISVGTKALFHEDYLALDLPSTTYPTPPKGKTLLVWGGPTSVGSNTIQLAIAAGYEVITTASPRNFDFCRGLGASQVFDYNSPTVKDELVARVQGQDHGRGRRQRGRGQGYLPGYCRRVRRRGSEHRGQEAPVPGHGAGLPHTRGRRDQVRAGAAA